MDKQKLQALLQELETWHENNEFSKIIMTINAVPEAERSYDLTCLLARAYNNLAVMGDNMSLTSSEERRPKLLEKALNLLQSVEDEGQNDKNWHFRKGYALYFLDKEAEALACFERSAELNPDDPDTEYFIQECKKILEQQNFAPIVYAQEDWNVVEEHINYYFGEYHNVFHELVSPDIHVDICIIPPDDERNYFTLVTMGMGAHLMNVPQELAENKLERAELMLALPPTWQLDKDSLQDERWYWPIRLLKSSARLPITNNTWLGWGHTIGLNEDDFYADNTRFCGVILTCPLGCPEGSEYCTRPSGDDVNFYQLTPLYAEEIEYKCAKGAEALLDLMAAAEMDFVVDINRPNVLTDQVWPEPDYNKIIGYGDLLMDSAISHLQSIHQKELPVRPLAAYNHLAIYLRWCIEHDLLSDLFKRKYHRTVKAVWQNIEQPQYIPDLRLLLRGDRDLNGSLLLTYFNGTGAAFGRWYYGDGLDKSHYYPCDVDDHARDYFGEERYNSAEFQDEAYLFVPWSEEYYQAMAKRIDAQFAHWQTLEDE